MPQLNIAIVPATFFLVGVGLVALSNMVFYSILGEVNGKRSPDDRFGLFFVTFKASRIVALHRELYPESKKRKLMWLTFVLGIAIVAITMLANVRFVSQDELQRIRQSSTQPARTAKSNPVNGRKNRRRTFIPIQTAVSGTKCRNPVWGQSNRGARQRRS